MSWNHLKPAVTILNKLELSGITCNEMEPVTNWPHKKQEIHRKKLSMVYYFAMYIIHPQGNTVGTITLQLPIRVYSSNLLHVIIAYNHLCFSKIFCIFLPNFPTILSFFAFLEKLNASPYLLEQTLPILTKISILEFSKVFQIWLCFIQQNNIQ